MESAKPAAVLGSVHTMRTRVDGSLSITVEIQPKDAKEAFAAFGAPGTPVALARITNEAAVAADRQAPDHGKAYADLYRAGWFYNPLVLDVFGLSHNLPADKKVEALKRAAYREFGVNSLTEIEPASFHDWLAEKGIDHTLPRAFLEAMNAA